MINNQIVWRVKGRQNDNYTEFKFSVKRDGAFVLEENLSSISKALELAISEDQWDHPYTISVYSKALEHADLMDIQYSPAYATFGILLLGLLAMMGFMVRNQRISKKKDHISVVLLSNILLWMGNTIALSGTPSQIHCQLATLYSSCLLSFQIG
jgi:hypothetical protein